LGDVTKEIRNVLRGLRKDFPVKGLRVVRRRVAQPENGAVYGYTMQRKDGGCTIVIHSTLTTPMALELLIHEYAHVMTWDSTPEHSYRWARAYQKLRQWFQGDDE